MLKPLLIEIGVEELPAKPLLKELLNIPKKWEKILEENSLVCEFDFFYTPRRLVLWHPKFLTKQPDFEEEFFGAPIDIAFVDNKPTKAALSFAKKCGVDVKDLACIKRSNREVLYYKKRVKGKESKDLLQSMIIKWLKILDFGKSMRWDSLNYEFIRPIRWAVVNLGNTFFDYEIYGIKASNFTYGHRSVTNQKLFIKGAKEYFDILSKNGVILYQDERYKKILDEFKSLEKKDDIKIEKDSELLDEVVAITEYPTVLRGEFDKKFLELPLEVIITSMKEHQRYFAVFKNKDFNNSFIVVSNAKTDDFSYVIKGNERVLKARLSDALFFWENDLKKGLDIEGLRDVEFMDGLGSLFDKEIRELKVALTLFEEYKELIVSELSLSSGEIRALIERAIMLSKADLLSEMVYEFPELQGIMGYYYALKEGEDELVALAIKEQYLPTGEDSKLPSTLFTSLISISVRLDTLISLFSIGKIPSGSKDPFALRRAANGIIRIVLDKNLPFNISKIFDKIKDEYKPFDIKTLEDFFIERIYQFFDTNPSLVKAVIFSQERDILEIAKKIEALKNIAESEDFKEIFITFKRVANIVKDVDIKSDIIVDETLFINKYEKELFDRFNEIIKKEYDSYEKKLDMLFGLKPFIDRFFDHVLVNVEDKKIRANRKNLIASIYKAFLDIADIKEISI